MSTPPSVPFRRRANPLAMAFRLSFIHGMYVLPAWYVLRDISLETLPGLLGALFSAFVVLTVFQIRLRGRINGRTDAMVTSAMDTESDTAAELRICQSFTLREYTGLNLQVMFSYLRPWLTVLSGLAFLVLHAVSLVNGADPVRQVLSGMIAAYFLLLPWILFLVRVRKAFRNGRNALVHQVLILSPAGLDVDAGGAARYIQALTDIAVTRDYILLYVAGSNYVQIRRDALDVDEESRVLAISGRLVAPA